MSIDWTSFAGCHVAAFAVGAGLGALEKKPTWRSCTRTGLGFAAINFGFYTLYKSYLHADAYHSQRSFEESRSKLGEDLSNSLEALRLLQEKKLCTSKDSFRNEYYIQTRNANGLNLRMVEMTRETADCEQKLQKLKKDLAALEP